MAAVRKRSPTRGAVALRHTRSAASVAWYQDGPVYVAAALASAAPPPSQRMTVPTDVLWQEHGPIFPRTWSDNLDDERLHHLDGVGHFTPVEAPSTFAEWINHATATLPEVEGKAQRSS